jgi:hypothetical protein
VVSLSIRHWWGKFHCETQLELDDSELIGKSFDTCERSRDLLELNGVGICGNIVMLTVLASRIENMLLLCDLTWAASVVAPKTSQATVNNENRND